MNLKLENIKPTDYYEYYEIFGNIEVSKYDDYQPITIDEAIETLNSPENPKEKEIGVFLDDKLIGIITILQKIKYSYIGYHFNPKYHGKGYAFNSLTIFLKQNNYKLDKFRLIIHPDNKPSIKLAEKLGFKKYKKIKDELFFKFVF